MTIKEEMIEAVTLEGKENPHIIIGEEEEIQVREWTMSPGQEIEEKRRMTLILGEEMSLSKIRTTKITTNIQKVT